MLNLDETSKANCKTDTEFNNISFGGLGFMISVEANFTILDEFGTNRQIGSFVKLSP